ncbi:plant virulence effector HPE1-like domain-containing protein [Rhizobium oryzicola]|uniref:Plant virulence effector HPE1-like domain-containing protein n=1 Tax=Rhizobium oryzicola TaxID=1232668 RepID=A0ABT8SS41_9HYPH|nr:plant virulence effector HPE1-like domain-containing protein [Rhizobium oryzicola]MDO1581229.1 plant virulence effector HPE1-like domain-containing protein [Rhizobium oryzicola]
MVSRVALMIAAFAASTAAANAGSIIKMTGTPITVAPSMIAMTCADCQAVTPDLKNKPKAATLPVETQAEVKNFYGKKAVIRTGAWMGGSPVTFVSLSPVWISEEELMMAGQRAAPPKSDGVDFNATTSAVGAQPGQESITPVGVTPARPTAEPDFNAYQLRPSI